MNKLSKKEKEVLAYLSVGMSTNMIAKLMQISEGTVEVHLRKIFIFSDSTTRKEVIGKALSYKGKW